GATVYSGSGSRAGDVARTASAAAQYGARSSGDRSTVKYDAAVPVLAWKKSAASSWRPDGSSGAGAVNTSAATSRCTRSLASQRSSTVGASTCSKSSAETLRPPVGESGRNPPRAGQAADEGATGM